MVRARSSWFMEIFPNGKLSAFAAGFVVASLTIWVIGVFNKQTPYAVYSDLAQFSSGGIALVVFRDGGCPPTRAALDRWLQLETHGLAVVGVMVDNNGKSNSWHNVGIPIVELSKNLKRRVLMMAMSFGYRETPFVVVWDQYGRLVMVGEATSAATYDSASALFTTASQQ